MPSPGAIFDLKIYQNALAGGASSRAPLGELTALPQTPSWFSGRHFAAGEGSEGRGRGKGREGAGSVPPVLFYTVTTVCTSYENISRMRRFFLSEKPSNALCSLKQENSHLDRNHCDNLLAALRIPL